jgi:hypothetical protein
MIIGRVIGWLLLLAALTVLGRDLIGWADTGEFAPIAAGQLWFSLDPGSLNLAQAAVQRHVAAWLWDPVIESMLLWWAVPVLSVPGLVLLVLCRRRTQPRRRR